MSFNLVLKKHPKLDCSNFNFYDQFVRIDFDFILPNSDQFIEVIPKVDTIVAKKSDEIIINVTVPKSEQYKLPIEQEIKLFMTARWISSDSTLDVDVESLTFQNIIYTLKFEPGEKQLVAKLV